MAPETVAPTAIRNEQTPINSAKKIVGDRHTEHQRGRLEAENREAYKDVMDKLVKPLRRKFSIPIELKVKEDRKGLLHARFIETQSVVVRVDRGFDFFDSNGGVKLNMFSIDNGNLEHLEGCRDLPDAVL